MWADNETTEDLLGFEIHGRLIRNIVTDPEMLPVTVGLFGDWGCGKSSVLKILQKSLAPIGEQAPDYLVVYFDTWLFEGYEDAKTAILAVLLNELKENKTFGNKIGDEASSLLQRLNWMKVAKVGLAAGVSYFTGNPFPLVAAFNGGAASEGADKKESKDQRNENEKWLRSVEKTTSDVRTFRDDFATLIKKTELKSLIVIVDDLDRCTPERVIDNLEAIKLFLNVPGVSFVIAADRRIVENAINVRYSTALSPSVSDFERRTLVTDYLEKLVQVPYTLPKLAPHEVRNYWSLLLCKKYAAPQFTALHSSYLKFIQGNRYEAFDALSHLRFAEGDDNAKQIKEHFGIIETCSDSITEGLKGNPRQIKRFLNALWMRLEMARLAKLEKLDRSILVKLMVLEYIDEPRFHELYESHRKSEDGTSPILVELEAAAEAGPFKEDQKRWAEAPLARWLRVYPKLSGVDLRDYFWISRSSINDAFAGVQLLSPAVRTCLEHFSVGDSGSRKDGVRLYGSLTGPEKKQVVTGLGREALKQPADSEAWEALYALVESGSLEASETLVASIAKADLDVISLKIATAIGHLTDNGTESVTLLLKERPEFIRRGGIFGRAVKGAKA